MEATPGAQGWLGSQVLKGIEMMIWTDWWYIWV